MPGTDTGVQQGGTARRGHNNKETQQTVNSSQGLAPAGLLRGTPVQVQPRLWKPANASGVPEASLAANSANIRKGDPELGYRDGGGEEGEEGL